MNYFEFYGVPLSLKVDQDALKKIYYANSKKYHPDFYTLESEAEQAKVLELSSLNNEAYEVLSDFDKRMKYVLDLKNVLAEEGKNQIPQDFLMDMMDINEGLIELEFDFDVAAFQNIQTTIEAKESELYESIAPVVDTFDEDQLEIVKEYYLKKKYLLRIQENLSKFAIH